MVNHEIDTIHLGDVPEDSTWKLEVDEPNTFASEPVHVTHIPTGREYTMYPDGRVEELE